jgi:hypothetical protein
MTAPEEHTAATVHGGRDRCIRAVRVRSAVIADPQ